MYGQFARFDTWAEIDSRLEGHFMERIRPGAMARTIAENGQNMRVLYHHGKDPFVGSAVLGTIRELEPDTSYEVDLFAETDYVQRLLPGLRSGAYGQSFSFRVNRDEIRPKPPLSAHNPGGLPEVSILDADVHEFGPTPLPAYKDSAPSLRSAGTTREVSPLLRDYSLSHGERWACRRKPGTPGTVERQRVAGDQLAEWEEELANTSWFLGDPRQGLDEVMPAAEETWRLR